MGTDSTRRQKGESPIGRNQDEIRAGGNSLLSQLAAELSGAIRDHRKWIDSDRARTLGTTFEVTGRLLAYGAYFALVYLGFEGFVDIRNGIATGIYEISGEFDSSRAVLFRIFAAGLVGPIAIIAIGIGAGWVYNLTAATAYRSLPRFAAPLVHPSVMFAVVAALGIYHSAVTSKIATGYLYAKATLEAASPPEVTPVADTGISSRAVHVDADDRGSPGERELTRLKAIIKDRLPPKDVEMSSRDSPGTANRDSSGERELVRLRSMFNSTRPCPKEGQGTELDPQPEVARPEPGLAPSRDCQVEKTAPHE